MFQKNRIIKIIVASSLLLLALVGCKKKVVVDDKCTDSLETATSADSVTLKNYILQNNIVADYDSRGFYYKVSAVGSELKPGQCSTVTVDYVGKLINGTQFDANSSASLYLGSTVPGFRMALPYIGVGGEVTVYIPPSLAYGNNDSGAIPGGSILVFKIKILAITKQ